MPWSCVACVRRVGRGQKWVQAEPHGPLNLFPRPSRFAWLAPLPSTALSKEVEGGAGSEPADLLRVQRMPKLHRFPGSVPVEDLPRDRDPRCKPFQSQQTQTIPFHDSIISRRIGERQREHPLLFEIRLMN